MTNKYNNWERLERVLEYVNMNANAFATHIGMQRSENIYHIKRGAFGISEELVDRITACYPEINPTWLLSGVGGMLLMIPLASVLYALTREFTQKRLASKEIPAEKLQDQPPDYRVKLGRNANKPRKQWKFGKKKAKSTDE